MRRTNEEKNLITKFLSGMLDGQVGRDFYTDGGSRVWTAIKDGEIVRYKQGPGTRFFNGKENERIDGVRHVLAKWITEDQILEFFQRFGWLMPDSDVQAYSAKFKPKE